MHRRDDVTPSRQTAYYKILILTMGRERPRYHYVGNSLVILSIENNANKNVKFMQ